MLLPAVSVTFIGVIAGLIFVILRRKRLRFTLPRGIFGAWIGFIMGTILGVIIDVIAQTGIFLGIMGHLMAVFGSSATLNRFRG